MRKKWKERIIFPNNKKHTNMLTDIYKVRNKHLPEEEKELLGKKNSLISYFEKMKQIYRLHHREHCYVIYININSTIKAYSCVTIQDVSKF